MKILMTLTALLLSTSVFASTKNIYQINMNLSIQGKPDSSMSIILEEGSAGSVENDNDKEKTFFDVVASEEKDNKGILMHFIVGYLEKDGSRKIISQPTILAKAGEEALITVGQKGQPEMNLKIIATRK